MRLDRIAFLLPAALAGGLLVAQEPASPPPGAEFKQMPARRAFDPDAGEIRPAEPVVPAELPGAIVTGAVVPAAYTEPAGELSTPTVTLNIEGSDVAPTGQAVVYKLHVRNASR